MTNLIMRFAAELRQVPLGDSLGPQMDIQAGEVEIGVITDPEMRALYVVQAKAGRTTGLYMADKPLGQELLYKLKTKNENAQPASQFRNDEALLVHEAFWKSLKASLRGDALQNFCAHRDQVFLRAGWKVVVLC